MPVGFWIWLINWIVGLRFREGPWYDGQMPLRGIGRRGDMGNGPWERQGKDTQGYTEYVHTVQTYSGEV